MSGVASETIREADADQRLDRWFKRRFPALAHGRLEKLLRTGQVRVDGKRAKAGLRLAAGQIVRLPPGLDAPAQAAPAPRPISEADAREARSWVVYKDADVLAIAKPPGLAVQGGTGQSRHLDALLEALRFDAAERPRLVHRLDRDTSGIMVLARHRRAAARLAEAFRSRAARKIYWALVAGRPHPSAGRIDTRIAKGGESGRERMAEHEAGDRAVTLYATIEAASDRAAWLALMPLTGRTHQLRLHCADALGTPIVGDDKYGDGRARLGPNVAAKLHLHARSLILPHPAGGDELRIAAPLPPHMRETWVLFGFDPEAEIDPFPNDREASVDER